MADAIKTFLTDEGPKPVDYTALANLPTIPSTSDINTQINTKIAANCIGSTTDSAATLWANLQALPDPWQAYVKKDEAVMSLYNYADSYIAQFGEATGTSFSHFDLYADHKTDVSIDIINFRNFVAGLTALTATDTADTDYIGIVDISAATGNKMLVSELKKLTAPKSGTATCPAASGWTLNSTSGLYYVTVNLTGVTASHKLHLTPTIDTSDTATGDAQQEAWDTHYYAESVAGGVKFYAKTAPTVVVTFTWEAVL